MNTTKMSLSDVKNRLTREEMKTILAGDEQGGGYCGDSQYGYAANCPSGTTARYCNSNRHAYCEDANGTCYYMGVATCHY